MIANFDYNINFINMIILENGDIIFKDKNIQVMLFYSFF